MKNKGLIITLIVIISIFVICLSAFMFKVIKNDFNFSISLGKLFNNAYKELVVDEVYEEKFDKINVTSNSGDIYVKHSTNDKVSVKIYSDKEITYVTTDEKTLSIVLDNNPCKGICIFNKISKIEIYVPESLEVNYMFNSKYGDIDMASFSNATLNIKSNAGDVDIIAIKDAIITSDYGDIKIGSIKNLKVKTSDGDIKIDSVDDIYAETKVGDIKLENVNAKIDITSDVGDIKITNANIVEDSRIKSNVGDIKIANTNDIYIDSNTKIGDIKVNSKNRKSDIVLTITSQVGDIKVNN